MRNYRIFPVSSRKAEQCIDAGGGRNWEKAVAIAVDLAPAASKLSSESGHLLTKDIRSLINSKLLPLCER
jgi:hypothetical protein